MTVKEAAAILTKKEPGRIILGYWEDGDDYIFNTKHVIKAMRKLAAPAQFVVTKDGEVYGTHLWRHNLDPKAMKKI